MLDPGPGWGQAGFGVPTPFPSLPHPGLAEGAVPAPSHKCLHPQRSPVTHKRPRPSPSPCGHCPLPMAEERGWGEPDRAPGGTPGWLLARLGGGTPGTV